MGITQSELAHRLGYSSKQAITQIENGNNNIPLSKVEAFAEALECQVSEILQFGNETPVTITNAQRRLLDASVGMKPEDLELAIQMIEALKRK